MERDPVMRGSGGCGRWSAGQCGWLAELVEERCGVCLSERGLHPTMAGGRQRRALLNGASSRLIFIFLGRFRTAQVMVPR